MNVKKIFSNQTQTITGAAIMLFLASLGSRVIGIWRDRIFAHTFGAGDILDAYYSAFRVPDFIYNLVIVGALSAGFIPVFLRLTKSDRPKAEKTANTLFTFFAISLSLIAVIFYLFAPWIVPLMVPGFSGEKSNLVIALTRIMMLSPLFLGLSGIASGILQANKNFLIYSLTPIFYNLGIIAGAIFIVPILGPIGLSWGVVIGAALHFLLQIPSLIALGFRYRPTLSLHLDSVREIFRMMIPRTLALAVSQINTILTTSIASLLAAGSIAIYNLASNLQYFPVGTIGVSFAIAAFPTLSEIATRRDKKSFASSISQTISQIFFFIIPLTIVMLIFRAQIVRLLLGSGNFDWNDTILTMNTLAWFSISLFAQCLIPLFTRAFFAWQDSRTPLKAGLWSAVINLAIAYLTAPYFGVISLAVAFSVASIFQAVYLYIRLRSHFDQINERGLIVNIFKICIASTTFTILAQNTKTFLGNFVDMNTAFGVLIQVAGAGTIGVTGFIISAYLMKLPEMTNLIMAIRRRLLRSETPTEIDPVDET
ncbi:MAG TPA: murein biosynthesis integral membrane protein MurJ [Candidatus Magasanikbacteria bacterium]|nr:murein biosynthesis integral membrane protein MurJ [Candidatus Magasanikbacteria bacterium]